MASIKSVPANSWQSCDVLSSDTWGNPANGNVGPVKVGASNGTTTNFWSDIDDYWYKSGYPEGKAAWGGSNGKDHFAVRTFGGSGHGRYLTGSMVTAVRFTESNDSTANSGLRVLRFGLGTRSSGGSFQWWDLSGEMSRPGTYGKTHTATFNSTLLNQLKSGWYIEKVIIQVSSAPSGTSRTTNTTVENLQFKTTGSSGHNLILPVKRAYSDRTYTNRISS